MPDLLFDSKYFIKSSEAAESSLFKFYVVSILGIYQNCNGSRYDFFGSYGEMFYFFIKKLIYGYTPQELILGGRFAHRIFAPNIQCKKAYLNIGINESKIDISGSIACAADEYQMQCFLDQNQDQETSIEVRKKTDVLLISQPFSRYKK